MMLTIDKFPVTVQSRRQLLVNYLPRLYKDATSRIKQAHYLRNWFLLKLQGTISEAILKLLQNLN